MTATSTARRHHYVPQGYLGSFTDSGTKKGQFFVLDVESGRRFKTSPKNVAVELDFNRIDVEGHAPDYIEGLLGRMENDAVAAIKRVAESQAFPSDEDYSAILHLICLVAVRNPMMRASFNNAREQSIRIIGDLLVSNEDIWARHVEKARADGIGIPESVSFQDMKAFVEGGEYDIGFHPQSNLRVEMSTFDKMLPILHERTWSLIIAPEDGPEFISSDQPAALAFKHGRAGPIGLATQRTELFFPLTRRLGMYGVYEESLRKVVHAKPGNVATMNQRVAFSAPRYVFSATASFAIWVDGQIQIVECGV